MKINTKLRKINFAKIFLALIFVVTLVLGIVGIKGGSAYAYTATDVIGNLYEGGGKFNKKNLNALAKKINANYTIDDLVTYAEAGNKKTSADFGDTVVEFGGYTYKGTNYNLKWIPVYLSESTGGEAILTLWLASTDIQNGTMSGQEVSYFSEGKEGSGGYNSDSNTRPASNNYSTSYIRSVALNIGSTYYRGYDPSKWDQTVVPTKVTGVKKSDNKFAMFTMGALANYIVEPQNVDWQNTNNSEAELWINDKIWLPSVNEVFEEASASSDDKGLWRMSSAKRANDNITWLRTGVPTDGNNAFGLNTDGNRVSCNGGTRYAVRPALHLNLSKATANSCNSIDNIYDETSKSFNVENLDALAQSAKYKNMEEMVREVSKLSSTDPTAAAKTSADFGDTVVKFGSYSYGGVQRDLTWIPTYVSNSDAGPILTLWLASTESENGTASNQEICTYSDGTYGTSTTSFKGSDVYSKTYDGSYIRNYILNGGNTYASFDSGTAVQSPDVATLTKFTQFTTGALKNYIVSPENVSWQTNASYMQNDAKWNASGSTTDASGNSEANTIVGTAENFPSGWLSDKLWLPSIYEICDSTITSAGTRRWDFADNGGLWKADSQKRANSAWTWLRSGFPTDYSGTYKLRLDGSYGNGTVYVTGAVRPALHLNLAAVESEVKKLDLMSSDSGKVFDQASLGVLFERLTGKSGATFDDVKNAVAGEQEYGSTQIPTLVTSSDLRSKNSYDLKVKFGDYYWTVTSLTTTNDGDPIITLYLDTSESIAQNTSVFAADQSGVGWWNNDANPTYMSNGYGTSYIRVNTLNAGGKWAIGTGENNLSAEYSQNASNIFAKYTMSGLTGNFTDYIAKPSQVKYQGIENTIITTPGWSEFCFKNEAYGIPDGAKWADGHDMSDKYNADISNKTGYAAWQNDYIWLPSITETGYFDADTHEMVNGIWVASLPQLANSAVSHTWLRSGSRSNFNYSCMLDSSGNFTGNLANFSYAVRPALHLNLAKATCEATGNHTPSDPITDKAATCTEAGKEHIECTVCREVLEEQTVNALGHSYGEVAWTWSDDGKTATATKTCTVCAAGVEGHELSGTATLDSSDTDNIITATLDVLQPATCSEKGWTNYTATVTLDGTPYTSVKSVQDVDKIAHTYGNVVWAWSDDGKTATATKTCTVCAAGVEGHEISETATLDNGITAAADPTKPATCIRKGTTVYTATITLDGVSYTDEKSVQDVQTIPHNYDTTVWQKDGTNHWHVCTVCGAAGTKFAHTDSEWVTDTEPTCTTAGSKHKTCPDCGETIATEAIPAKGHTLSPWQHDENEHWKECYVCSERVDVAGHNWSDWKITKEPTASETGEKTCSCSVCGQHKAETIAKLVQDEGGSGNVSDLPVLTDPDSNYELEITVKATDKIYALEGVSKGYDVQLWIVDGEANKHEYDSGKEVTLSLIVPDGMEEFTLYKLENGVYEVVEASAYTVENGVLRIRTTLPKEFVFNSATAKAGIPWWVWLLVGIGSALIIAAVVVTVVVIKKKQAAAEVKEYDDAELKARLDEQGKRIDELANRDDGGFNDVYKGE